ncbi:MAG: sensor domain-containing diguanylate cyclase [Lachnospiraceae bacterium]|nr:sensor domain-containing diguanylate cyclase [Lachnospiraceae bacterium]
MISQDELKNMVDNSIRSMYQMIAVICDSDAKCMILDHNSELGNISPGKEAGDVTFRELYRALKMNVHPEDRDAFSRFMERDSYVEALKRSVHLSLECRLRHIDRRYYWSELVICNTTAEDSTEGNDCIFMIRDINERKSRDLAREAEDADIIKKLRDKIDDLTEESITDHLTGCYNRKVIEPFSKILIDDAIRNGRELFVCMVDLNGLKHINDSIGHEAGDTAIETVAKVIKDAAPTGSKVIRNGGDEFLILASVDKESPEPGQFAVKVDSELDEYNKAHTDTGFTVGASYGFVLLQPAEGMTDLKEHIEKADELMYEMRRQRDEYRRD